MTQIDPSRGYLRTNCGIVNFRGMMVRWSVLTLGERIAWHRCRCGLTQLQLSIAAGTAQSAIARYEAGVEESIRITTLRRIAEALRVCCGELLD